MFSDKNSITIEKERTGIKGSLIVALCSRCKSLLSEVWLFYEVPV